MVHGEEFRPEDAGFDTDKISAGTIVDGITDEGGEPEDDPKNFGMELDYAASLWWD